jgi:mycothiol S-conjugate amidase
VEASYYEWLMNWPDDGGDPGERVNTRVRCDDWFETRDKALLAHETQIDPTSRWFFVPMEIQQEIWPTEDYELVRSLVDSPTPEDDLFAGLRAPVAMRPAV